MIRYGAGDWRAKKLQRCGAKTIDRIDFRKYGHVLTFNISAKSCRVHFARRPPGADIIRYSVADLAFIAK